MAEEIKFDPGDRNLLNFLRNIWIFQDIGEDEIRAFAPLVKKYLYKSREVVFADGEIGDTVYMVEDGSFSMEKAGACLKIFKPGDLFGEIAMLDRRPRVFTVRAMQTSTLLAIKEEVLQQENILHSKTVSQIYKRLALMLTSYIREEDSLYNEMDVLLVQDGGCAPGYNPVTAFIAQFFEQAGRQVFIAAEGFKSLVQGERKDFRYLVYSPGLYKSLEKVPGVVFVPPLRDARGANFRTERYKEFVKPELQQRAAKNIMARNVKAIVGIGGNGTFAGINELSKLLPESVQIFFVPVTIDSDIFGTDCVGEYTGVEVGAEKIRCYMADARTHKRCYIIEMMGNEGGYHALHSCLGAGAHLAVLPSSEYDVKRLVDGIKDRDYTVIVVAEGYKKEARKKKGFTGSASEYFRDELLEAGLKTAQRIICENFTRDIRGAATNNMDITLAQRMARKLTELLLSKQTRMMPAVQAGHEYAIRFDQIRTDNFVESELAVLANRLST